MLNCCYWLIDRFFIYKYANEEELFYVLANLAFLKYGLKKGIFISLPDGTEIRVEPTKDNPSTYWVNVIKGNSMVHIENNGSVLCWDFKNWRDKPDTIKMDEVCELISDFSAEELQKLLPEDGGIIFSSRDKTKAVGISF